MNTQPPHSEEQRSRADKILFAAMDIEDDAERMDYVQKACAGDEALYRDITQTFALEAEADQLFQNDNPAGITAADIADTLTNIPGVLQNVQAEPSDDDDTGQQVGPYKLLKKIGEGGVGKVYLAEQSAPVRRQVALKIIKQGMDTKSVIARFKAERQAMALMEHPNIAHVLNAGETDTGRPFFVMELVHGERITTFCDGYRLNVTQRLELFIQVCHAIQHAHQKGIIHRDIKPSNVLVSRHDGAARPIVIDFGIAKATEENLLNEHTVHTAMGPIIGTPAYMSPEQASLTHIDIDTRSDIYSLGVLLYELLAGAPPFDQNKLILTGIHEMCRILREKEPPTLAAKIQTITAAEQEQTAAQRGTDLRRLRTALSGDLNWIVLKAMDKERDRRYESAGELAAEIQRFLNNELVTARPPSRRYRLRKLIRRNKATFIYLTAIFLAVLAGLGGSTWLFIRERAARSREQQLLKESNARARIAQAYILITRGLHAQAAQLLKDIPLESIEPSLEATEVFRALAAWSLSEGRWPAAADCYLKLQQANQLDIFDTTEVMARDVLGAGPALIIAGAQAQYHTYVQETIIRFRNTTDPSAAEQIIKNSLLIPAAPATLQLLPPLVAVVEKAITADEPNASHNSYYLGWRTLAITLYEYRLGHFKKAADWGERCLNYSDKNPARVTINHMILAMTYTRLNRPEQARQQLAAGRQQLENRLPEGTHRIIDWGTPQDGSWHDWIIATIFLQEAEALLANRN